MVKIKRSLLHFYTPANYNPGNFHWAKRIDIYSKLPTSHLDSFSSLVRTFWPTTYHGGLLNKSRRAVDDHHWFDQSMRFSTVSEWQAASDQKQIIKTAAEVLFWCCCFCVCETNTKKKKKKSYKQAAFWDVGSLGFHWLPVKQNHRRWRKWAVGHMASVPSRGTTTPPVAAWSSQCR